MTHDPADVAREFLDTRRALTQAGAADEREQHDATLRDLARSDAESALTIMRELSHSEEFTAREAVAIYVRYLFPTRPAEVAELLVDLLNDTNPDIARQALTTIDELTGDPDLSADQAAQRIREMTRGE